MSKIIKCYLGEPLGLRLEKNNTCKVVDVYMININVTIHKYYKGINNKV